MIVDRMRVFNMREWRRHPGRTVMSFVVVAISAMLLVAVFGIAGSITGSADRFVAGIGGNASLEVSGVTDTGLPEAVRLDVAKVPGVAAAVPMLRTSIGPASERVVVLGVDESINAMQSDLQRAVQEPDRPVGRRSPTASRSAPRRDMRWVTPLLSGNGEVTVAAVITGADAERINGGNFILGPLPLLQRLTDRVGMIDSVLVVAAPERRSRFGPRRCHRGGRRTGRRHRSDFPFREDRWSRLDHEHPDAVGGVVLPRRRRIPDLQRDEHGDTQRRPTISLLRAVGAKKWQIVRDLLAEAGLVGLVGGIARIGAGCSDRQTGNRRASRWPAAGPRIANRIHPARLRDSRRRRRMRCRERGGGGTGGPPGVQGGAGRSPGTGRRVRRRRRRAYWCGWWRVSSASE